MAEYEELYKAAQGPSNTSDFINFTPNQSILKHCKTKTGIILKRHQEMALHWMRKVEQNEQMKGGIYADGPGLGKTITVLSTILSDHQDNTEPWNDAQSSGKSSFCSMASPTLIICPNKVLLHHWTRELKARFDADDLSIQIYEGLPFNTEANNAQPYIENLRKSNITFITIPTLVREHRYYVAQQSGRKPFLCPLYNVYWHRICVDEVQEVEGAASIAAKMAKLLKGNIRWGISGTPITRGLVDLAGMAQFLKISPFDTVLWWKNNSSNFDELKMFISNVMWRTPYHLAAEYLKLPKQIQLPAKYIRSSSLEFAMTQPLLDEYNKILLRRTSKFRHDKRIVSKQDLRKLLANPIFLKIYKSATLGVTSLPHNEGSNGIDFFTQKTNTFLNQFIQKAISISESQGLEYNQSKIIIPWDHPMKDGIQSLAEQIYFMMKYELRQGYKIPSLTEFHLLTILDRSNGKYKYEYYKQNLLSVQKKLPNELWGWIFSFLPADYDTQRIHLFRDSSSSIFNEISSNDDLISKTIPNIKLNLKCENFKNEIEKIWYDFHHMFHVEAYQLVGRFEQPLFKKMKEQESVDYSFLNNFLTKLLSDVLKSYPILSITLTEEYQHIMRIHTEENFAIDERSRCYYQCDHMSRKRKQKRIHGREERWKTRDQTHAGGRGSGLVEEESYCFFCEIQDHLDNIAHTFEMPSGSPTICTSILRSCFPDLLHQFNLMREKHSKVLNHASIFAQYLTYRFPYDSLHTEADEVNGLKNCPKTEKKRLVKAWEAFRGYGKYLHYVKKAYGQMKRNNLNCKLLFCGHITQDDNVKCLTCGEISPFTKDAIPYIPKLQVISTFSSKVETIVQDILNVEAKCLIFSQWSDALELLRDCLNSHSIENYLGNTRSDIAISKFTSSNKKAALLLPLKSCNHGLNLPEAQHVFLMEPCLQPALEEQAIARVRRLDQQKSTYVHRYITRNSIESKIYEIASAHKEITRDQIYGLFSESHT